MIQSELKRVTIPQDIKKKKHIPHGSWVKITYLKKSEIIVSFEVMKHKKDGTMNNYSALSQSP